MKKIMIKFIILIAVAVGAGFLYITHIERKSVFFPLKGLQAFPSDFNLAFRDVYLTTKDNIKLHSWFIPHEGAAYTLLFCHGNGSNISNRLDKILVLHQAKVNIFIIDYRGYGLSSGRPTEKGVYFDAQAGYDYLINRGDINPEQIILYGESLGSAVIIDLACREKVGGVIVEGAFSSGRDMGKILYPYIPKNILPDIFNSLEKIKRITAPKLFLHSLDDEIVPLELGEKLYQKAPEPKYFIKVSGGHNDICFEAKDKYLVAITVFLSKL